eukprot:SAG11_NODE_2647_length_3132_cov_3.280910_1_plen_51_part_00
MGITPVLKNKSVKTNYTSKYYYYSISTANSTVPSYEHPDRSTHVRYLQLY